jgi:Nucleotidyl transferase of unknown function (DUF2204)
MNSKEEMPASSHFKELLRKLNGHQVRYLIVGAYAVMKYTEPRYTKDLDIWIEPTPENADRVFRSLAEFGAPMAEVTTEDFTNVDLVFQIGVAPHRIDILMAVKGLDFSTAWNRRVEAAFEDVPITLVCKEDLLVSKEAAGRPQDKIDAALLRSSDDIA